MAMKGIEQTLWIIIAVVIFLVVAVVVLVVFTGGIGGFMDIWNPVIDQQAGASACRAECELQCINHPEILDGGTPNDWPARSTELKCSDYGVPNCVCTRGNLDNPLGLGNTAG